MKFTSIIFTASESILEIYLTYTHKRARIDIVSFFGKSTRSQVSVSNTTNV